MHRDDVPPGTSIISYHQSSIKNHQVQEYTDKGRIKSMNWGVEIKGYESESDNIYNRSVIGDRTIHVGKTPYHDQYIYSLPCPVICAFKITSNCECDVTAYIGGEDDTCLYGTWRILPATSTWIHHKTLTSSFCPILFKACPITYCPATAPLSGACAAGACAAPISIIDAKPVIKHSDHLRISVFISPS